MGKEQLYGENPIAQRKTDLYKKEYVHSFVRKWDELIDWAGILGGHKNERSARPHPKIPAQSPSRHKTTWQTMSQGETQAFRRHDLREYPHTEKI